MTIRKLEAIGSPVIFIGHVIKLKNGTGEEIRKSTPKCNGKKMITKVSR
jgi:hypothetical protein